MRTTIKRLFCLLLAMVLLVALVPMTALAAEDGSAAEVPPENGQAPPDPTPADGAVPPETGQAEPAPDGTEAPETTPETTGPVSTTSAETTPPETVPETTPPETVSGDTQPGASDAEAASGFSEAPEAAETTYSVYFKAEVTFPDGVTLDGSEHLNILGLRDINITWGNYQSYSYDEAVGTMAYCIEPGVEIGFNGYDSEEITIDDVWLSLSVDQRRAIGIILLYGAPNMPVSGGTANQRFRSEIINQLVTAAMVHEIIKGYRSPVPPYARIKNNYYNVLAGDDGITIKSNLTGLKFSPDSTDRVEMWGQWISGSTVRTAYEYLESRLALHNSIPSFADVWIQKAPTHTMERQPDGSYLITLTDTNDAVKNGLYDFSALEALPDSPGLTVVTDQEAGTVTITAPTYDTIPKGVVAVTRDDVPNPASSSFLIWRSKTSGGQTVVQMKEGTYDPVPAYFKLKSTGGSLEIQKVTSDGENLEGWQFEVYSDAECTTLVGGPFTTDADGKIQNIEIPEGNLYVKEIGNADPEIGALYTVSGDNPQQIECVVGGSYSLTFQNELNPGYGSIVKTTNTGKDLAGWQFAVSTDKEGNSPVAGSPFTTDETGVITVELAPGTYYVRELSGDADRYWMSDNAVKTIAVKPNETSEVTFQNTHIGWVEVYKTTNTGTDLDGWEFGIFYDEACTEEENFYTTDSTGKITTWLPPGTYYIKETGWRDIGNGYQVGDEWLIDTAPRMFVIEPGETVMLEYENVLLGKISIQKATNTGLNLDGWQFGVYNAAGDLVETLTTDAEGKASSGYLAPGSYTVKETGSIDGKFSDKYWTVDSKTETITVTAGETAALTFTNCHTGEVKIIKTITQIQDDSPIPPVEESSDNEQPSEQGTVSEDGTEIPAEIDPDSGLNATAGAPDKAASPELAGWQFVLTDSKGVEYGPYLTDEYGEILVPELMPGSYTVREILPEGSLYVCTAENPQTVEVVAGQTAEVSFNNQINPGQLRILKTDTQNSPVAGATFLLEWSQDGTTWQSVSYSDKLVIGGCFANDLADGCLTSGEDGIIVFDGLYPGLFYRLTETQAPNGYTLLSGPVFEGQLPADTLLVELNVVNTSGFGMPMTGGNTLSMTVGGGSMLSAVTFLVALSMFLLVPNFGVRTVKNNTAPEGEHYQKVAKENKTMKKFNRFLSLLMALCLVFGLSATAMAADVDSATIDESKTASLTVFKYDLTSAMEDGVWTTESYVSTGVADVDGVQNVLSDYAIEGVEFTYLKVADIDQHQDNGKIVVVYGFAKDDALLTALGLTAAERYSPADDLSADKYYFLSDTIHNAMAAALEADKTGVKNTLENYIDGKGAAMTLTDATGFTSVEGLPLGLYLLVETEVPENVTATVNPFFVSLPMTSVNGTNADNGGEEWMYDVTVYPKNETGTPTLEKTLRESQADTGKNNGSSAINDGFAHTGTASAGDVVEYQIISTLPAITSGATYLSQYTFADTLSGGISYNKSDVQIEFYTDAACTNKVATWTEADGKFTVSYADGEDGSEIMTISMTETGLAEINGAETVYTAANAVESGYSKCTLRITYACTLNSDTSLVLGDAGNPNDVELTWGRTSTEYIDELVDDCHVYSFGIDLTKTFSDGKGNFANVEFVMRNSTDGYYVKAELNETEGVYYFVDHVATEAEATRFVPVSTTDAEGNPVPGKVIVHGLEDDSYIIIETRTDDNYTLLKDNITVTIAAAESTVDCGIYATDTNDLTQGLVPHKLLTATASVAVGEGEAQSVEMLADGDSENALAPLSVTNTRGGGIPQTGEIGAIWMPIVGSGLLVIGLLACVIVLTRKKEA